MSEGSDKIVLVELVVSDPVEVAPGRFETILSHPSLAGQLILSHGKERNTLLSAVAADIKEIDPVSSLFRNLVELRNKL